MKTTVIALHGYTMHGASLRAALAPIEAELGGSVEIVCPDAPRACEQAAIERMYAEWRAPVPPGPHLTWWNSIDDGRVYEGWERTRDELALLAAGHDRLVILGFSQGAMVATALAALVGFGEFPPLAGVVVVAARLPRAEALAHYFERPIRVPSLHVWGLADKVSGAHAPRVFERFDVRTRECAIWNGPHVVPSSGPGKDAIVEYLRRAADTPRR